MEVPQHLFLVPALKSSNSGAKANADVCTRFDNPNHTKPNLPSLLGPFNRSKYAEKKSKVGSEVKSVTVPHGREPRPSRVRKCVGNGAIDGSITVAVVPVQKALPTKATVSPTVPRQTVTPLLESQISSRSPRRPITTAQLPKAAAGKPMTPPAAGSPLLAAGKVKTSTERKDSSLSRSPVSSRKAKVVRQLPTPPPTPPLDVPVPKTSGNSSLTKITNIPRSNTMIFPKSAPVPRSKPMISKRGFSSRPSVSSHKSTIVHHLPTPPSTPPLEAPGSKASSKSSPGKTANIPRSKVMIFPKLSPVPRTEPMVFKPEFKAVLKPVSVKVEIPKKVEVARVHQEGRSAPVSTLVPKPLSKAVRSIEADKLIISPSKIPRRPGMGSKAKSTKLAVPKNKTLTNVVVSTVNSHPEGRVSVCYFDVKRHANFMCTI
jgi:hypothetical protein